MEETISTPMVKRSFFVIIILLVFLFVGTNQAAREDVLGVEILGSGGLGALTYESRWAQWGCSLGFSLAPIDRNNGVALVFPMHIRKFFLEGDHRFVLGTGQAITITTKGQYFLMGLLECGWMWKRKDSPWAVKLAYTPLVSYLVDFQWQHWAGFSCSYAFSGDSK